MALCICTTPRGATWRSCESMVSTGQPPRSSSLAAGSSAQNTIGPRSFHATSISRHLTHNSSIRPQNYKSPHQENKQMEVVDMEIEGQSLKNTSIVQERTKIPDERGNEQRYNISETKPIDHDPGQAYFENSKLPNISDPRARIFNHSSETEPLKNPNLAIKPPISRLSPAHGEGSTATSHDVDVSNSDDLLFHKPRQFHIPHSELDGTNDSSESPTTKFWSYSMYRGPEEQKVIVHYCRKLDASERIAQLFLGQKLLGFDMEWKPNVAAIHGLKKNVSLIQLASEDRVALFHIALHYGNTIEMLLPPTLKMIMEDPTITKAGVAIKADCSRLKKFLGVESRGLFELSHLYKLIKNYECGMRIDKSLVSLSHQVQDELQMPMHKGEVRYSDWSQELDMKQIVYAASDAYAAVQLFATLDNKRRALNPSPPLPHHAELNLPISTGKILSTAVVDSTDDNEDDSEEELEEGSEDLVMESDSDPQNKMQLDHLASLSIGTVQSPAPDFESAQRWVADWKSKRQLKTDNPPIPDKNMLCYVLWHHQGVETAKFCTLFDRPLRPATVACYILEAISLDGLPYDQVRLEKLTRQIPYPVMRSRFRQILQRSRMATAVASMSRKSGT